MLQQPQTTLDDDVLQNRSRWHVNGATLRRHNDDRSLQDHSAAQVHSSSDGQMIQFEYLGNAGDPFLEVADLFEVGAQLDQGRRSKPICVYAIKSTVKEMLWQRSKPDK